MVKTFVVLLAIVYPVRCANILAIFVAPSYSHQLPLLTLSKALAARGHNLTVITQNPSEVPIANHTEIDISFGYKLFNSGTLITPFQGKHPLRKVVYELAKAMPVLGEMQLKSPQIQNFMRWAKHVKFDIVLYEMMWMTPYLAFVHTIGSPPVIGVSTLDNNFLFDGLMGSPSNPAYMPAFLPFSDNMSFTERLINLYHYCLFLYYRDWIILPKNDEIIKQLFGHGLPSAYKLESNKTLFIYSSDIVLGFSQPLTPNVVQVGPLHIVPPKPLPQDLQTWVDSAKEGLVYFSLGSNMMGTSLPSEAKHSLFSALSALRDFNVIWKWESDTDFPGHAENILYKKWIPQQDLLASNRVAVFISQCGLQSTQEAIYFGVNLICIPLFADQDQISSKVVRAGIGIELCFFDLTKETVYRALKEIIFNSKYKKNMQRLSAVTRDRILSPVEEGVWWVEHVVRHGSARHLRPATLDIHWAQYFMLDVVVFIVLIISIFIFVISKLLLVILRFSRRRFKIKIQ